MRLRTVATITVTMLGALACSESSGVVPVPVPGSGEPPVLLKEINIPSLPAPFYHFEYDATGKVSFVSYASELTRYDVVYDGGRISELRNNILVNKDRLGYHYDAAGRVDHVTYSDSLGVVYVRIALAYDGPRLVHLERERSGSNGFTIDKTMTFSYYADGNLLEITDHQIPIGSDEVTFVDRFEQYDDKTNVDGFSLIHNEFFDHFVFLPGVRLQKGNPARQIRTGSGRNFTVAYTYSYDAEGRPLSKTGAVTFVTGPNVGRLFHTNSVFSYY